MKPLNSQRSKMGIVAALATLTLTTGFMVGSASAAIRGTVEVEHVDMRYTGQPTWSEVWNLTWKKAWTTCTKKYPETRSVALRSYFAVSTPSNKRIIDAWWDCRDTR